MAKPKPRMYRERGPFRADQLREGDPYELRKGHPIRCEPAGGRHGGSNLGGGAVLATDPAVEEAGVDVGYSPEPGSLRAPDIAVGNVPDQPGWVPGAPSLAVEYADRGQDEQELEEKVADLLEAGTRWVWVVRLAGPRRVEVHEQGGPVRTLGPGEELTAPGVLANPVRVEALWDPQAARALMLRNLLQREGFADLDAVRDQGRADALRGAVRALCEVLDVAVDAERARHIDEAMLPELESLLARLRTERRWPA